jgi:alanine racemase
VRISRSRLAEGARRAAHETGTDAVADLSRDAYGHGIDVVAEALAQAGVTAARVDPRDRAAAETAGIRSTDATPTLDPRALYGLPRGGTAPAMRLAGSLLSMKALLAGEGVSYNYTHIAPEDTRIALVSGGFGQGVARELGNRASVEIRGDAYPIVGRVAMDVCVVDIGDAPLERGDEVVYFGGDGPARDALEVWEATSGLTAAELVCTLGLRLPREVVA